MPIPFFQIDAFTDRLFAGNPAAVMLLERFAPDDRLQAIAAENNLSETAFLVRDGDDYRLRWFTPTTEVPLCGHATLASAAAVMERVEPERRQVVFHTLSGALTVRRLDAGYSMDFPARRLSPARAPATLAEALGTAVVDVCSDGFNLLVEVADAATLRTLEPDIAALAALGGDGIIVTAAGDGPYDFVSRYFAPTKGIDEDPVTGSAHCGLTPYWARRLGKTEMLACQASTRGGVLRCVLRGDRVELRGRCVFFLEGQALI